MIFGKTRKKLSAWNHRQSVKNAVSEVKEWKWESREPAAWGVIGLTLTLVSLLFWSSLTIGSIGLHAVFFIIFGWIFVWGMNPKNYPRSLAYMTHKERVHRIAKRYGVDPEEVFEGLQRDFERNTERVNKRFARWHKIGR